MTSGRRLSFAWPSARSRESLETAFEAAALQCEAMLSEWRHGEAAELDEQAREANAAQLRSIAMFAPDWVAENVWLAGMWALRLIRQEHMLAFYAVPAAAFILIGVSLSRLVALMV